MDRYSGWVSTILPSNNCADTAGPFMPLLTTPDFLRYHHSSDGAYVDIYPSSTSRSTEAYAEQASSETKETP